MTTSRSSYMSVVEDINRLSVSAIPSKPLKNVSAIRIDRTVVLVDQHGVIYSTQVQGNFSYNPDENGASIRATITGASRLGVISQQAMKQDLDHRSLAAIKRDRDWAAQNIEIYAKTIGLRLTAAQIRQIESNKQAQRKTA